MKKIFCENCGVQQDGDALFCESCGSKINIENKESPAPKTELPVTQAEPTPPITPSDITEPEKTSDNANDISQASPAEVQAQPSAPVAVMEKPVSPPQQPYASEVSPQPKKSRVIPTIISILLSIFILGNILLGIGIIVSRSFLEESQIKKICDDTDLSDLRVGNLIVLNDDKKSDDDATLAEWISNNLDPVAVSKYNMTPDGVNEILKESTAKDFIRDKLLETAEYMRGDSSDAQITVDEIMLLLENNAGIIYDATGYEFIKEDYDNFRAYLKESNAFADSETLSLASDGGIAVRLTRIALSTYSFIILSVITLAFIIALFVLNKGKLRSVLLYLGIPTLLSGLVYTVYGIGAGVFAEISSSAIGIDIRFIERIINSNRTLIILSGLLVLLVGAVFIAIYAITSFLNKKKQLLSMK